MRIVSLLPSATEILWAIGAGPSVVGVTFECDEPAQARTSARVVSTSALPHDLSPAEIDAFVSGAIAAGQDLYHLDRAALDGLDASLLVTQDLCAVCAVDVSEVESALEFLQCSATVLTTDPHTLSQVWESIESIGAATGFEEAAHALATECRSRVSEVTASVRGVEPVTCAVLEWTDPPFTPGHWVPDMIDAAGGIDAFNPRRFSSTASRWLSLSKPPSSRGLSSADEGGGRSKPPTKSERTTWPALAAAAPEVIIAAPCGFTLPHSRELAETLVASGNLPDGIPVWAVDANASFARPGPRLTDGVEALARILHPELGAPDPAMAVRVR